MSDELFEIPVQLSPRLRWIEKHGFLTHFCDDPDQHPWMAIIPMDGHTGSIGEIMEEWCGLYDEMDLIGWGDTEREAINDCAVKNKIKLWNES